MGAESKSASGGVGFTSLLLLLFIGLKLTGYIDWSWWWVLSPIWLPLVLICLFAALFTLMMAAKSRK